MRSLKANVDTMGILQITGCIKNGFIQIDGEKMSKSLGNFMLLRELLKIDRMY